MRRFKMTRIKINDLPRDQKISKDELKRIRGGVTYITSPINLINTTALKLESTPILDESSLRFDKW